MATETTIRRQRGLVIAGLTVGLLLVFYGLFIGAGPPAYVFSVLGTVLVIWMVIVLVRKIFPSRPETPWRPGDEPGQDSGYGGDGHR